MKHKELIDKLKPCPFCKGKAEIHGSVDTRFMYAQCENCGNRTGNWQTLKTVRLKWNTR